MISIYACHMEVKMSMDKNRNLWDIFIGDVEYILLGYFFDEEYSFQEND